MSNKSRLLVIGNSHIECLQSAIKKNPDIKHSQVFNLSQIVKNGSTIKQIVLEIVENVRDFNPDSVCVCLSGNEHNILGVLENPIPFSVGEKSKGSTSPSSKERHFIPYALMEDYFDSQLQKPLLSLIYQSFPDTVRLYLNPPPPISDFSHIQKYPGVFRDKLELGSAPNDLKMQLYRIQSSALRKMAEKENAIFVDVEPGLLDSEGFLNSDYFNQDPTHGNAAYGKVMLERLITFAASAQ